MGSKATFQKPTGFAVHQGNGDSIRRSPHSVYSSFMENFTCATERVSLCCFLLLCLAFQYCCPWNSNRDSLLLSTGASAAGRHSLLGHRKVALWSVRNPCTGEWMFSQPLAARHHTCSASPNNLVRKYYLQGAEPLQGSCLSWASVPFITDSSWMCSVHYNSVMLPNHAFLE